MGRFSKLRAPAVGWPVAPPPPVEPRATAPPAGPELPTPPASGASPSAAGRNGAQPAAGRNGAPPAAGRNGAPPTEPSTILPPPGRAPAPPATPPAALPESLGPAGAGFRDRARARRRLRYLRQVRELAFRDLGGFVFDSRRFGRPREDIVDAKVTGLLAMDRELRTLAAALDERQELLLLHEPGITACRRCGAIHGSDANFCPSCGLPRGDGPRPLGPRPPLPATPGPVDQATVDRPPPFGE